MKKTIALLLAAVMLLSLLAACSKTEAPAEEPAQEEQTTEAPAQEETPAEEPEQPAEPALPDGVYTAEFDTDSSMFHANEACDGKGTLTVKDGKAEITESAIVLL